MVSNATKNMVQTFLFNQDQFDNLYAMILFRCYERLHPVAKSKESILVINTKPTPSNAMKREILMHYSNEVGICHELRKTALSFASLPMS